MNAQYFKMKKTFLIFFGIFLFSCEKQKDCIIITQKRIIGEQYYFFFENENAFQQAGQNNNNPSIPDTEGSGVVTPEVYDTYQIGDEYCY